MCSIKRSSGQPSHPEISVFNLAFFANMAFPSVSVAVGHRRRPYNRYTLARRVLACLFNKAQLFVQNCSSQLTRVLAMGWCLRRSRTMPRRCAMVLSLIAVAQSNRFSALDAPLCR